MIERQTHFQSIPRRKIIVAIIGGLCMLTVASALAGSVPSGNESWDVVYDGVDSAADNVFNFLRWDSAIDDDWNVSGSSFKLNTPSAGFMSVDRVTNPTDHNKTGNIWTRDPILSNAAGFTMEVGVKINPNSNPNAFSMTYLDNAGSFGVHLSPNGIKVGDLAAAGSGSTYSFNTTDASHVYRIVKDPNSYQVKVYVDGGSSPVAAGSGNSNYATGSSPHLTKPRVLIGDNENNPSYNANYVLDFVQYRRGSTAPGQIPPALSPRVLPAVPAQPVTTENWTTGYDGVGQPMASGWIQAGGSYFIQQPNGIMELNGNANARLGDVANSQPVDTPGWDNGQPITIEARLKVLPDSQQQAFNLVANDILGDTALVLSPDKVQLMHAYMPVGAATINMNTTDDFHLYRLVRDVDGLYWHLYIDNNPVASIDYQHSGGNLLGFSRIWFGDVAFPNPAANPHVLIDYVRWHEGAAAAVPEPAIGLLVAMLVGWSPMRRSGRRT